MMGTKRLQPRMNPTVTKEASSAMAWIAACSGGGPASDDRDHT
jgi:hypothetical protein